MTDSYLPITALIDGRHISRDDVLGWEAERAVKVAGRLGLTVPEGGGPEVNRRIVERKLELGYDTLEQMLKRDIRLSDAGGRVGAVVSRGRRKLATTVLSGSTGSAELIPHWYREQFATGDGRSMLGASPDHWIFRHRADARDEIVETAAASPFVIRMFFDEDDPETGRTAPDSTFPVEWVAIARDNAGRPIGGIRHRFRDQPDGFVTELNVEFPATMPKSMITWHCWHLASEFSNWLEFANGFRDPGAR